MISQILVKFLAKHPVEFVFWKSKASGIKNSQSLLSQIEVLGLFWEKDCETIDLIN